MMETSKDFIIHQKVTDEESRGGFVDVMISDAYIFRRFSWDKFDASWDFDLQCL